MTDADEFRRMALALEGTTVAAHVDRTAFRVARIYATMPADGLTANLRLAPEEQEFRCLLDPDAFSPVPNAWGRQGWTTVTLAAIAPDRLAGALQAAWRGAQPKPRRRA